MHVTCEGDPKKSTLPVISAPACTNWDTNKNIVSTWLPRTRGCIGSCLVWLNWVMHVTCKGHKRRAPCTNHNSTIPLWSLHKLLPQVFPKWNTASLQISWKYITMVIDLGTMRMHKRDLIRKTHILMKITVKLTQGPWLIPCSQSDTDFASLRNTFSGVCLQTISLDEMYFVFSNHNPIGHLHFLPPTRQSPC